MILILNDNKQYPVIYIQVCFIIVENVKPLNDGALLCVGDNIVVVLSYISLICLDRTLFEGMSCSVFHEMMYFVHGWVFCGYFANYFDCSLGQLLSTYCVLPLIFSWTCMGFFFLKIILLYSSFFTFPAIKLPSLPASVYYLLCDQIIYITFVHSIIWYLMEF